MSITNGQLVVSLFPGIGLLDMAFEAEGFHTVRGPDLIWGGDIRTWHPAAGRFDGMIGGPPCQTFSTLVNLVRSRGYEPKFGNLIPEFERCIREARPDWFLMENVTAAPAAVVEGYGVTSFVLNNAWLGEEQERKRRFSFGRLGREAEDLSRNIETVALMLPRAAVVTQRMIDNSAARKGRVPFTADGKLKAVANGVPIAMGRAVARAIAEVICGATKG